MSVNLLRGKVDEMAKSRPSGLGTSEAGRTWCLKALHPADEGVPLAGMPDASNFPSVTSCLNVLFRVNAPTTLATPTWGFDMSVLPDLIQPLCLLRHDNSGVSDPFWGGLLNPQYEVAGASTYDNNRASFLAVYEQWRMTYMSVTITQDAPALADEGIITAVQTPSRWVETNPTLWNVTDPGRKSTDFDALKEKMGCKSVAPSAVFGAQLVTLPHVHSFNPSDNPTTLFATGVSMPGAYVGKAKDGLYMPLKLTKDAFDWKTQSDCWMLGNTLTEMDATPSAWPNLVPIVANSPNWPYGYSDYTATSPSNGATPVWAAWAQAPSGGQIGGWTYGGSPLMPWANGILGHINVVNADKAASFQIRLRMGIEARVGPGTFMTPQQHLSYDVDEQAISTYFAISRQLADGYPGSYNDLGKLWEVIKSIGRSLKPVLSAVPMTQPFVGPISMLGDVVDSWVGKSPKGRVPEFSVQQKRQTPSSVGRMLEGRTQVSRRAPQVVEEVVVAPRQQKKKKNKKLQIVRQNQRMGPRPRNSSEMNW
jgi:hypothetical protein